MVGKIINEKPSFGNMNMPLTLILLGRRLGV
uniref:Uncharacterized protein n=1 Tax=Rhizophora mucronata TaxID=61149 RepID=A0A2P2PPB0_RHIMU